MAKRKTKKTPAAPPRRSLTLVQQARRVAQVEMMCRSLRRQLSELEDRLRTERKFLRDLADPKPDLHVGELT